MNYKKIPEVNDYFELVRHGDLPSCPEQFELLDLVEPVLTEEDLFLDTEQLGKYLALQKYFPYNLFEWQKFTFALHNCLYDKNRFLRYPHLLVLSGRGTGKNGYISFEGFSNMSPASDVKNYQIEIFATSEDQAMVSFEDIRDILRSNEKYYKKYFEWNKKVIRNKKTGNSIHYNTSNAQTKDGRRPGSLYFDEYHEYADNKLVDVARTGLGKVAYPKEGIFTTDGFVRGGPLDKLKTRADDILKGKSPDLGLLPFICRLPNIELVDDERNWHMANPSLRYLPNLLHEYRTEYADWLLDRDPTASFIVKRMNIPPVELENDITTWDNILATNREIPDLTGCECVPAIDYAKTNDFVAAGCLFKYKGVYYWLTHTWVCKRSPELHRVKAPLDEWERAGFLTFVDAPEIDPEIPVEWIMQQLKKYNAKVFSCDNFRYTLLAKALRKAGFDLSKKRKNLLLTKQVTQMRWAPVIKSAFAKKQIVWGDNPLMRWYTNNACESVDKKGNITFEKKDPKSRKTDGFMALVHAFCGSENLKDSGEVSSSGDIQVYTY